MDDLSVADQMAYEALPADVRALCDRVVAERVRDALDPLDEDASEGDGHCRFCGSDLSTSPSPTNSH